MKDKSAIILPLKESFSFTNFGAVSIWVNDYISYSIQREKNKLSLQ